MNTSTSRNPSSAKSGISFPVLQSWNPMTQVATIAAQVNGKRVLCRISKSALEKKFGVPEDSPMNAVTENRHEIEDAARKLIENEAYEEDGSIVIEYKNL